jgi:tRNA nucleotidyltransferase/poly(A) polymerase
MPIVADGYERFVCNNEARLRRMKRISRVEVCRNYQTLLEQTSFVRRTYLRLKRWLELQHQRARLEQELLRNLY